MAVLKSEVDLASSAEILGSGGHRHRLRRRCYPTAKQVREQLIIQFGYTDERTWAVRENHWNGSILDEIETVLREAETMTWKGRHPVVKLVTKTYEKGVKLTKKEMNKIENLIQRLTNLENSDFSDLGKWFVDIDGRTIQCCT